jgi:hypothetical protein
MSLHRAFSPWRPGCWRSIDAVPAHADGAHPLEEAQPIDLATALSAPEEFGCLEE